MTMVISKATTAVLSRKHTTSFFISYAFTPRSLVLTTLFCVPRCSSFVPTTTSAPPSLPFHRSFHTRSATTLPTTTTSCLFTSSSPSASRSNQRAFSLTTSLAPAEKQQQQDIGTDKVKKKMETYPDFDKIEGLHPTLVKNLQTMGIKTMTEIQAMTWEAASKGQDVLGRARTGTGKSESWSLWRRAPIRPLRM